MMQAREATGLQIAHTSEITRLENLWIVPSQSSHKKYAVDLNSITCTCPDFEERGLACKHIFAAQYAEQHEQGLQLPEVPKVQRPTYKQEWTPYNQAQTNEKAQFLSLLYSLCQKAEDLPRKAGAGRSRLPLSEMIFCAVFKVFSLVSGRRFISDLQEAQRRGYISKTPHFNSIFNYLELEEMTDILKQMVVESSLPLKSVEHDFAVDSSGFSTGVYKKWVDTKWGKPDFPGKRKPAVQLQDWVKVHLMCGVKTNVVTSVEITHARAGDNPQFAPLVEQTAKNFTLREVSADKAYSSAPSLQLVLVKGGQPFIPFKRNTNTNSYASKRQPAVWQKMYHQYMANQGEFARHYHKRSNVETTFSMIKRKFGERLRSKTRIAQENEVLCKILSHNLCCVIQSMYELGIDVDFQ